MTRLIFLLMLLAATQASAERRALLLSNGDYSSSPAFASIEQAHGDADRVAAALEGLSFTVERGRDLDLRGLEATVARFTRGLKAGDTALVYYVGQGAEINGEGYLIPSRLGLAGEADLPAKAYRLNALMGALSRVDPSVARLVFIDACGFINSADRPFKRFERGTMDRVQRLERPSSLAVVFSTTSSRAGGASAGGALTRAFIEHIKTPSAGMNQVLNAMNSSVFSQSGGHKSLWFIDNLGFDFSLSEGAAAPERPLVQLPQPPPRGLILDERFDDNRNGWTYAKDTLTSYIQGGAYVLDGNNVKGRGNVVFIKKPHRNLERFVIEAALENRGQRFNYGYGIIFGGTGTHTHYRFEVAGDGHFTFGNMLDQKWNTIQGWTKSRHINKGQARNVLKVVKAYNRIDLFINNILVYRGPCPSLHGDAIGFSVNYDVKAAADYITISR